MTVSTSMREIVGYVPVQPDGSVRIKIQANVPLAISVLAEKADALQQDTRTGYRCVPEKQ